MVFVLGSPWSFADVPSGHVVGLAEIPSLISSETGTEIPYGKLNLFASPDPKAKVATTVTEWRTLQTESFEDVPRALVFETRKDWLLVKAGSVTGWVAPQDHGRVANTFDVLKSHQAFLKKDWDRKLWSDPEVPATVEIYPRPQPKELTIDILDQRTINGVQWVHINIIRGTCGDLPQVEVLKTGWVPAYVSRSGDLNVWYYAGGC